MKQLIRCIGCGKITGQYKSYKVHITDKVKNFLTGEVSEQKYEGKICRECSAQAGYRVRIKKLDDSKTQDY